MRTIPGEVRERVLADHEALRGMIRGLRKLVRAGDLDAIRAPWTELLHTLRAHLALEDEMLIPTLHAVDPALAEIFRGEHETQRAWIARTLQKLADPAIPVERLLRDLRDFNDDLERDMDVEEAAALNEEGLPDDAFGVELPSGS